jgi:hypothetical protein
MPTTLILPSDDRKIDCGMASSHLADAARYAAMARALELEYSHTAKAGERPFWAEHTVNCLNEAIAALGLEVTQTAPVADPIDALFERANVLALNGQVLR